MGLQDRFGGFVVDVWLERPAVKMSLAEHGQKLTSSGQQLAPRFEAAADTARHRAQLRHIIGIERWGQSRLRTLLGDPLEMDEYDGYRPDADADWEQLLAAFLQTRQDTVELAGLLEQAGPTVSNRRAPHNQFGPLSARGWLRYLDAHANLEAKRLR